MHNRGCLVKLFSLKVMGSYKTVLSIVPVYQIITTCIPGASRGLSWDQGSIVLSLAQMQKVAYALGSSRSQPGISKSIVEFSLISRFDESGLCCPGSNPQQFRYNQQWSGFPHTNPLDYDAAVACSKMLPVRNTE